jgi:hypothetical protein
MQVWMQVNVEGADTHRNRSGVAEAEVQVQRIRCRAGAEVQKQRCRSVAGAEVLRSSETLPWLINGTFENNWACPWDKIIYRL